MKVRNTSLGEVTKLSKVCDGGRNINLKVFEKFFSLKGEVMMVRELLDVPVGRGFFGKRIQACIFFF